MSKLDAQVVYNTFINCLLRENETAIGCISAAGIMTAVNFHPERLAKHTSEIIDFLAELPDQFMSCKGGGWSFLGACNDKNGNLWTGEHRVMEMLFLMGMAINKVEMLFPRNEWNMLPGGMPYYVITI